MQRGEKEEEGRSVGTKDLEKRGNEWHLHEREKTSNRIHVASPKTAMGRANFYELSMTKLGTYIFLCVPKKERLK